MDDNEEDDDDDLEARESRLREVQDIDISTACGKDVISSVLEVKDLRKTLQSKVGSPFTTNVLRIALNSKEVSIASMLVYAYKVSLDESMLVRAIKTNQLQFLYCTWAFQKNYERVLNDEDKDVVSDSSDLEMTESDSDGDDEKPDDYYE